MLKQLCLLLPAIVALVILAVVTFVIVLSLACTPTIIVAIVGTLHHSVAACFVFLCEDF